MTLYTSYLWDFSVACLYLFIGRLLPKLQPPHKDLSGKVALVTGANSGIGLQIALELASQGATVYLACRNASKAEEAVKHITDAVPDHKNCARAVSLDTSSLASVRKLALEWSNNKYPSIDILVHNAGLASIPPDALPFTSDGFDLTYATNFLGSFLLTHLLEKHLAPSARIIFTTSTGHYGGRVSSRFSLESVTNRVEPDFHIVGTRYNSTSAYSQSKFMQVAFARLLQKRWDALARSAGSRDQRSKRIAHAFSPDFTHTPIFAKIAMRNLDDVLRSLSFVVLRLSIFLAIDVSQGAATGVWLCTTDDAAVVRKGGDYWDRCQRRVSAVDITEEQILDRLWLRWEADAGIEWRT